jgi:hypothetical protein
VKSMFSVTFGVAQKQLGFRAATSDSHREGVVGDNSLGYGAMYGITPSERFP